MKNKRDKKGSVTVFLIIFFVALLSAITVFIEASRQIAVKGCVKALGQVWAQAVLAEYDLNLQRRYGIFGFYGMPAEVDGKIDFYAKESFKSKKYIHYGGAQSRLYDYSLINTDNFRKQAVEAGKFASAGQIMGSVENSGADAAERKGVIRNRAVLDYLPSKGCKGEFSVLRAARALKDPDNMEKIVSGAKDRYFIKKYADAFFKDKYHDKGLGETFFQNEKEYLVSGEPDDGANFSSVRNKIVAVREVLNYAYLQTDKIKYEEAFAVAELIAPGPAAPAACQALLASWALAESVNDWALLQDGHKVPVWKTEEQWALDLDSVMKIRDENYIFTGIDRGKDYEDYLNLLLDVTDERVLLLRMMDLIQINMRYLYYDDFLLSEYNCGVDFFIEINGRNYEVEKEY